MNPKTYTIDNIAFMLKTDLTLNESEEVSNLLRGLYCPPQADSGVTIAGNFTGAQIKRFLEIVLEPVSAGAAVQSESIGVRPAHIDKDGLPEGFNLGKIKESVQMEVFKDFFIERLAKLNNTASIFAESIRQQ
ncbi:MAG: hypothetical protein R6W90_08495 [Ignavibacteriaceae bacterium]